MFNKKLTSVALVLVLLAGSLLTLSSDAGAWWIFGEDKDNNKKKVYTIRAGIGLNDKSAQFKALEKWKQMVEKRSDGRIEMELYHSSQLGDDREMMEALQLGTQEVTCPSTAPIGGFIPEFKVFDLPFLFPSNKAADYVLDGPVGQRLLKKLEKEGLIGLAYWENGFRHLTNSVRAVKTPADIKGLKVRTMENPIHLAAWEAMGANPTPMAFGELFSAMQQGVVDGQENPWGTIYLQNFYEVQDYVTNTGHVYSPFVLMVSEKFYDKLPSDLQKILRETAKEVKDYQRKINREMNAKYREKLKDKMNVTILSAEEKKAFQKAVQPVYEKYEEEIGAGLIKDVMNEVEEYQNK
ncbi:tripartite ATP-independent periplasmic transporter solute receptor, DctP family [Halobacteroides halobius DSM 5150]|uniref:Tripartite ATP-independent periplasmic transporter solute receptor, DctP family n=1 Tax=Halobacteroides halobius (strain ATCC 35273 / DSM 5150 / MD-1) TaxID=748449 RepID=L0KCY7_HALHC|nr:TRAP transporter substrate-binding protein [Halobacteroides halobius]AGB42405.1 tripartite ATP-independent periplasmic transporter solute receptor, DctP family [Halobacteroides halobius DSM 5150]